MHAADLTTFGWRTWRRTKDLLRAPPVLRAHREAAAARQLWEHRKLLRSLAGAARLDDGVVQQRLAAKATARQPLWDERGTPCVAALGFSAWEAHGFWQSFARLSHFVFIDLGRIHAQTRPSPLGAARRAWTAAAIDALDAAQRTHSIRLLFVYADSDSFDAAMLGAAARERGIWLVVMGLDCKHRHYERRYEDVLLGQDTLVPHVDVLWTNWPSYAQAVLQRGGTAWFAPQGADPAFFETPLQHRDIDVLFLGQKYGARARLVHTLRRAGLDVHTAGAGWPSGHVSFADSLRLLGRARVVLGYGATGAMRQITCLKGRDFEVPMAGALYVTSFNPELTDCYHVGQEIVCYDSMAGCIDTVVGLLRDPAKRAAVRAAGQLRARRTHTWARRIADLLALFPR